VIGNPYAPPQPPAGYGYDYRGPPVVGFTGDLRGHKPWVKWAYLVVLVVSVLALVGGIVCMVMSDDVRTSGDEDTAGLLAGIGALGVFGGLMLFYVKLALALVWLHAAWSWVPFEQRFLASGKPITPGGAVGFMFIPYYNLYWMFVANTGLCDALERMRLTLPTPTTRATPRGLAIGAAVCQIIPLANLVVAPFLWFFYMHSLDAVRAELAAQISPY